MIVGCLSFDFRRVRLLEFQCRGTSFVIVARGTCAFSHGTCKVHKQALMRSQWACGQCIDLRREI